MSSATSNITFFAPNQLNRSSYFKTMFDTTILPYNKMYNNCIGASAGSNGGMCYTWNKGTTIYKPHTDVGTVGTSAAGYLARRKRM